MSVTIPGFVVIPVAILIGWFIVGQIIGYTILAPHKERYLNRRGTSVVPATYYYVAGTVCGPIGWALMAWDAPALRRWRKNRRQRRFEKAWG